MDHVDQMLIMSDKSQWKVHQVQTFDSAQSIKAMPKFYKSFI